MKRKRGEGNAEDTDEENVKRRREEIVVREKDIQEVNLGDDTCDKYQRKFPRTSLLMKHTDKYHKHTFMFNCKICNKGFMTVRGYEEHKVQHGEKSLNVLSVMWDSVQRELWPNTLENYAVRKQSRRGNTVVIIALQVLLRWRDI